MVPPRYASSPFSPLSLSFSRPISSLSACRGPGSGTLPSLITGLPRGVCHPVTLETHTFHRPFPLSLSLVRIFETRVRDERRNEGTNEFRLPSEI